MADDVLAPVKEALERRQTEEARELVDRARREHPDDPEVREMYAAVHLALAVRLSSRARDLRRQEIVAREIPYDVEFEDSPEVAKAFDEAAAAIEEVLAADPRHEKGLMMKASLAFRSPGFGSEPSSQSTRSARPISPHSRHSHPRA